MTMGPAEAERFADQGFLVHRAVLAPDIVAEARARARAFGNEPKFKSAHFVYYAHLREDPFWVEFASHPALRALAEPILGRTLCLCEIHLVNKGPFDGHAVPWHQDAYDVKKFLSPVSMVVFCVALDDADAENGCLRVIPGSHKPGVVHPHGPSPAPFSRHFTQIDPRAVDESLAVDVELAAGDVEQHGPYLIHGSSANRSARHRSSVTIFLTGPDARNTSPCPPVPLRA